MASDLDLRQFAYAGENWGEPTMRGILLTAGGLLAVALITAIMETGSLPVGAVVLAARASRQLIEPLTLLALLVAISVPKNAMISAAIVLIVFVAQQVYVAKMRADMGLDYSLLRASQAAMVITALTITIWGLVAMLKAPSKPTEAA